MNVTFNENDFIELETRGRIDLANKRRQQSNEMSRRHLQNAHVKFLWKTYFYAMCLILWVLFQWHHITSSRQWPVKLMTYHSVEIGAIVYINFLFLISMPMILQRDRVMSNITLGCYILTMFEISSAILITPLTEISLWTILKGLGLTLAVGLISLSLALIYHFEMEHGHVYITVWSIRYFLISSVVLFLSLVMDNLHAAACTTLILVFFLTVYAIVFGRSLGSLQFYRDESPLLSLYVILTYLLFLALLASSLKFFQQVENIMQKM